MNQMCSSLICAGGRNLSSKSDSNIQFQFSLKYQGLTCQRFVYRLVWACIIVCVCLTGFLVYLCAGAALAALSGMCTLNG